MTYGVETFEGTEGAAATTVGLTGPVTNGGTIAVRAAAAAHGNFGVRVQSAAYDATTRPNAQCVVDKVFPTANQRMPISVVHRLPAAGFTNQINFGQVRHSAGKVLDLLIGVDGALLLADSANAYFGNPATGSAVPVLATAAQAAAFRGQRVRYSILPNLAAATPTVTIKVFDFGTGAQIGGTVTYANAGLTANPIARYRFGVVSSNNSAATVDTDDLQWNDGGTEEIGDLVAVTPPLAVSGTQSPATGPVPNTEATVTLTSSGGNGNAVSYAISVLRSTVKNADGSWNFTGAATYLDTRGAFQASPVFRFTPTAEGGYSTTYYAQQA